MRTKLEPTGERMIEEAYHRTLGGYVIYLIHSASYAFAEKYCNGKRVLDLGCGSGYGASRIASLALSVHAVDISPDAVAYSAEHYSRENVHFSVIEPDAPLPFADESFDVVLSFQVIEHVVGDRAYLREASRVLAENGVLILITPDRKNRLFPYQKPWNRWHLREYKMTELYLLASEFFKIERALEMGMREDIAPVELQRYQFLKWFTLPFTLPFLPEIVRQNVLGFLHKLRGRQDNSKVGVFTPSFGIEVVEFSEHANNSLNLVIVASSIKKA